MLAKKVVYTCTRAWNARRQNNAILQTYSCFWFDSNCSHFFCYFFFAAGSCVVLDLRELGGGGGCWLVCGCRGECKTADFIHADWPICMQIELFNSGGRKRISIFRFRDEQRRRSCADAQIFFARMRGIRTCACPVSCDGTSAWHTCAATNALLGSCIIGNIESVRKEGGM